MTTILYKQDQSGAYITEDLTILADGLSCESDILGNMDITQDGTGVYDTPDDMDDIDEDDPHAELKKEAIRQGARYYAESESAAQWWIDYVVGYRDTQDDVEKIRDELDEFSDENLEKLAQEVLSENEFKRCHDRDDYTYRIIETLYEEYSDYEDERRKFVAAAEWLHERMNELTTD